MKIYFLYILHSKKINKYYIGVTTDINERLAKHNKGFYKNSFTKASDDWKIILTKDFKQNTKALCIERFIKRMKSAVFIKKIIDNPSILNNIDMCP